MKPSKAEMIRAAWKKPEMPESYMDVLRQSGFITGTHVYGMPNGQPLDQDWVVNVPPKVFDEFCTGNEHNGDSGYWEASGMTTLYGHYRTNLINIICISDIDMFNAWFMTTEIMKALDETEISYGRFSQYHGSKLKQIFKNKYSRVRVFRALRDVFYPVDKFQVKEEKDWLPLYEAFRYRKCRICTQEARNFTNKAAREAYEKSGICERCATIR